MAAPAYTEDLTDIDLAESDTGWTTINFSGGGGAALDFGPDLAMQGVNSVLRQVSGHDRGGIYNNGATAGAVAAGVHIFQWLFTANPGLTDTIQNTGVCVIAGSGTGAVVRFHVDGNDTFGAAGRVGKCYAFRYNNTANSSPPYRTLTGSPGATPAYFGGSCNISQSTKGLNFGLDAVRYGTGAYLTAGELISAGDGSDNPCTFDGFATENDYNDVTNGYNRWGIFTKVGNSYELQGRFVIGQNNSKVATLCRFRDSDVGIVFVDTIHSETDFTQVIIDHASTRVEWTNVNFTALGTHNPGRVVVNNATTPVIVVGGVWTGIGITTLRAGCDITNLTWRATDQITLNSATLDGCLIENNTAAAAIIATTLDDITGCTFVSDGTGYAVDLGTISSTQSMAWDNSDSGYAATDGSTGNETIKVTIASPNVLTINVAAGATTPTIHKVGTGTVNVVAGQVALTLTGLKVNTEVRIYTAGTTTELDGVENSGTSFTYNYTYVPATTVDIVIHHVDYEYIKLEDVLLGSGDASIPIQQVSDRWYDNP